MSLFISSFEVIFPLLAMLLVDMLAKKLTIIKDGEQLVINRLFSQVIMPCFISSYPLTSAYDGDGALAGEIITFTTIGSLATKLFMVYDFRRIGYF